METASVRLCVPVSRWDLLLGSISTIVAAMLALMWLWLDASPAKVLLIGLLALTLANYVYGGRDVLNPAFTFTAIWSAVAGLYNFCPIRIDPLEWKTVVIFLCGGGCFSLGSFLGNRPFIRRDQAGRFAENSPTSDGEQGRTLLLVYVIFATVLFAFDTARIAGGGFSLSPMYLLQLRTAIITSFLEGDAPYSSKLVSTGPMIAVLTLWIFMIEEKRKWVRWVCAICVAMVGILSTGRTLFMQAICGCYCLWIVRRKDRSFSSALKPLITLAAGTLVFMIAITFLTKSETQGQDATTVVRDMTFAYAVGPLAAFNHFVYYRDGAFQNGCSETFADLVTPLSRHGITNCIPPPALEEFIQVPFPMNVYTAYKPYYADFGVLGCLLAFGLLGLIEGQLFYGAVRGNRVALFYFAYLAYALMFSTFADAYHLLVRHLYVLVFSVAYFFFLRRIRLTLG